MMKTILATFLAATFLISVPVRAEDKAPAPAGEKAEKAKGKKDKQDQKDKKEESKDEKPAGGGW
jgi:ribosomal protein L12E/L44/L45/RPP1/RPP2